MRRQQAFVVVAATLLSASLSSGGPGSAPVFAQEIAIAEIKRDTPVDFETEVLPLFKKNCLACHNATTAESRLVLETPETILKGGDSGPSVVPKNGAESLLLGRSTGKVDTIMPPKDNKVAAANFTPEELGLIKLWIDQGATGTVSGIETINWQPLPPGVNPIYAVAVSPDGQYAACGRANQIFIYHLPTGRFICRLTDPELLQSGIYQKPGVADLDLVQSLAFSADGSVLASGGYRTIKLWRRPRDVKLASVESAAAEGAQAIAVSADSKWLATAAADHSVKLWDLATGQPALTLTGHTAPVTSLRFAPDGLRLVSASLDKTVRFWQLPDGAPMGRIDATTPVQAITLVGDGTQMASAGGDNLIRLWKTPAGPARQLAGLPAPVTALAVSPDKKTLAAAGADGAIQLVDLTTGQAIKTLAGHAAAVTSLAFQASGARLASVSADKTLRVWDVAAGQLVSRIEPATGAESVALHPSGNQATSGAADGALAIWKLDVPAPRILAGPGEAGADEAPATVAAVSLDGKFLATAGLAGGKPAVLVRDVAAGTIVKSLLGHEAAITALAFSADGARLASGSEDKTARVWSLADGVQVSAFAGHTLAVGGVAFDPTGQQVLSGSADASLKLWNAADGAELKNLAGHAGAVVGVSVITGGQRAVSASADQTVRIWNLADGQQLAALSPGGAATALAVARDDSRLAVACADNSIKLFQLSDNQLVATLAGHAAPVKALAFSSDNARVVSTGGDQRAIAWDVVRGASVECITPDGGLAFAAFGPTPAELLTGSGAKLVQAYPLHFERALVGVTQRISGVAYNTDGSLVFAASADGTARGFQTGDGQQRFSAAHGAAINALAASADGKFLATAGEDNQIRVWNAGDGSPAAKPQLAGFTGPVKSVAFSADSLRVIGGGANGQETFVFNVASGELEQRFAEHAAAVSGLGAGGELADVVVSASADNSVRVWSLMAVRQLVGHGQPVTSLDTMPTAPTQIVSGSLDGIVRLWNTADGQTLQQMNHAGPVTAVAVRGDGLRIASAGANNLVRLWNAQNFQQVAEMKGDYRAQLVVAERERGVTGRKNLVALETAAATAAEQAVTAETDNVKKATEAQAAAVKALAEKVEPARVAAEAKVAADKVLADATAAGKAADEAKVAADKAMVDADAANKAAIEAATAAKTALDGDANNQDLIKAKEVADKAAADAAVALTAATEAKTAADKAATDAAAALKAATDDATAKTKAADDAEAARKAAETAKVASDKGLEAAGAALKRVTEAVPVFKAAVVTAEENVKVAEAAFEAAKVAATQTESPIRALAFSADNLELASGGDDRIVHTWSAETGAFGDTYTGQQGAVLGLAYAGPGKLVSAAADQTAVVYSSTPEWVWERTLGAAPGAGLIDRVTALDFSPDGKLLASGGGDPSRSGELKIWSVADGSLVREIAEAHSDTVLGVDFSPEGNLLASCGADKFVKVFDVATGGFVKAFEGHTHHVLGVTWRSDAKVLASCGADNVIKVWDFVTGDQKTTIAGFAKEVTSITFVGVTPFVLSSSGDMTVRRHNVDNGQNTLNYAGGADFMYSAATTPDGKIHIAGGQDSVLRAWNGENAQAITTFPPPPPPETDQQAAR